MFADSVCKREAGFGITQVTCWVLFELSGRSYFACEQIRSPLRSELVPERERLYCSILGCETAKCSTVFGCEGRAGFLIAQVSCLGFFRAFHEQACSPSPFKMASERWRKTHLRAEDSKCEIAQCFFLLSAG